MDIIDIIVLVGLMTGISFYGLFKSLNGARQSSANEVLHGANVSILSSALSVCSGFLSAVSLLGFPAEIYYQGTMLYWYGPMYMVAFPLAAFIFLPVFYRLKLTSIYEYLELRFNFGCRFMASITFCLQTLLYISVALYAPALALSSATAIPLSFSILVTAVLSALYVSVGGAKAGIYTSSLQMALILISMVIILLTSMWRTTLQDVLSAAAEGGRLQFTEVVLLNIPFNFLILTIYVGIGLILYHAYRFCDPFMQARDRLFPHFVVEQISVFPGLVGLFLAAIYSAGLSTLSASYSALGAVVIEDVIKQYMQKLCNNKELKSHHAVLLARVLPLLFCVLSIALAYLCSLMETMMLQISLTIFGVAGGPVLSVFCLGMFFPYIKGFAAFMGQLTATLLSFFVAGGALISHVRPVGLPLDRSCGIGNVTHFDITDPTYGMVYPLNSDSELVQIFRISYQYYSIIALVVAIIVAHVVQLFTLNKDKNETPLNSDLLSTLVIRKRTQNECCTPRKRAKANVLSGESDALAIKDNEL